MNKIILQVITISLMASANLEASGDNNMFSIELDVPKDTYWSILLARADAVDYDPKSDIEYLNYYGENFCYEFRRYDQFQGEPGVFKKVLCKLTISSGPDYEIKVQYKDGYAKDSPRDSFVELDTDVTYTVSLMDLNQSLSIGAPQGAIGFWCREEKKCVHVVGWGIRSWMISKTEAKVGKVDINSPQEYLHLPNALPPGEYQKLRNAFFRLRNPNIVKDKSTFCADLFQAEEYSYFCDN